MDSQDEYTNRILGVSEEDMIIDRGVTRRMKVISEWNGGRLILVDMPDEFELRRQNKHEFWNKEWTWETNLTIGLTKKEINRIKEIADGWE